MIVFVNNRDSFVWNLVDYVSLMDHETVVVPNTTPLAELERLDPDGVVLSPGPGTPHSRRDVGVCLDVIKSMGIEQDVPVLGVCLGMQAIAVALGGSVCHAPSPIHGKTSTIVHDGVGIFKRLESPMRVGRYHSLMVGECPPEAEPSAVCIDESARGVLMGIRVRRHPVEGVQFHPESILTPHGMQMIKNFVGMCR
ncbi:MAG: anthranilate synthase component II [Methermicoccaceae archaeon]